MDDLSTLEDLRALAPRPDVRPLSPERLARHKETVMREVVDSLERSPSNPRPVRTRRTRRRLPVLIAAVVTLVSGAAVGWALVTTSSRDTVAVQCRIQGSDTIIPASSGDPVADCAAKWQASTGDEAPRLVAYDNGVGGITVLAADDEPPSGFTPLHPGETQNVAMVQMQQWLDDHVRGLGSGCYDDATAVQMTEQELARLGMTGWTVRSVPAADDGPCVGTGILDAPTSTVSLRAMGGPLSQASEVERLAVELRAIAEECAPLDATVRRVRSEASELGLSEDDHAYELTAIRDDALPCTTIVENVGGTIFVILRGPSG